MNTLGKWAPVAVWMALIFLLSAQSQLPTPEQRWLDVVLEKSGHVLEYMVLTVLLLRALASTSTKRWRVFGAALIIAWFYALSDEYHQSFVPGRSADWTDVVSDWMGALLGAWLWCRGRSVRHQDAVSNEA